MATKIICDKCKKEITKNHCRLELTPMLISISGLQLQSEEYDLCENCYITLVRVLKEYLPE